MPDSHPEAREGAQFLDRRSNRIPSREVEWRGPPTYTVRTTSNQGRGMGRQLDRTAGANWIIEVDRISVSPNAAFHPHIVSIGGIDRMPSRCSCLRAKMSASIRLSCSSKARKDLALVALGSSSEPPNPPSRRPVGLWFSQRSTLVVGRSLHRPICMKSMR